VTFLNIQAVTTQPPRIELAGFDAEHGIDNVLFDQVTINGHPVALSGISTNNFVQHVTVRP